MNTTQTPIPELLQRKLSIIEKAVANHRTHITNTSNTPTPENWEANNIANRILWNTVLND